jgi:integrase/recombinase XerD
MMPSKNSQPEPLSSGSDLAPSGRKFDPRTVAPFHERSVSEETRRAYRRVVKEFFTYFRFRHPAEIVPAEILAWREHLSTVKKRSASTVALKLSVIRSMYDYLQLAGYVSTNPALTKLVPPPALPEDLRGRALTPKEVRHLLSGPDRARPEGARDYALLLLMLKTSLRVSEACGLKASSIKWSHGRWVIKFKVKGGRERTMPLPPEAKKAIDEYLKLDRARRSNLHSDGADSCIFQPIVNYRTLEFDRGLSSAMAWNIVRKWGAYTGVGHLSPHDLRRTAITRALDQGLSYRQVQMMSGHRDPKTVMRYDHGRENMDQNAVNFLDYAEDAEK